MLPERGSTRRHKIFVVDIALVAIGITVLVVDIIGYKVLNAGRLTIENALDRVSTAVGLKAPRTARGVGDCL